MKGNYDFLIGVAGFVVGFIGIGYAIGSHKRLNDICDRIGKSIDNISENLDVIIPETVVDKAVEKATRLESERAVRNATDKIIRNIEEDIRRKVTSAVNSEYSNIKKSVTDKTAKEVSKIDIRDLSSEIREKAKEEVISKLDDNLDDILEKYNKELERVGKIYKSISDTFVNNRGTTFTIS